MKTGQVLSTLFDASCDENLNFYHTRSSLAKSCAIISILVRINNFFVLFTVDLSAVVAAKIPFRFRYPSQQSISAFLALLWIIGFRSVSICSIGGHLLSAASNQCVLSQRRQESQIVLTAAAHHPTIDFVLINWSQHGSPLLSTSGTQKNLSQP